MLLDESTILYTNADSLMNKSGKDVQSKGPTRSNESSKMEKNGFISIVYKNADSFIGKRHELKILIAKLKYKPQIIATTEIKNKRSKSFNSAELNLEGYKLYTNDLELCARGVLIYVDELLDSKLVNIENKFEEFVIVQIKGLDEKLIVGNFYRSPNSSSENDIHMYKLVKDCCEMEQCKVVLMGDFNFPDIA